MRQRTREELEALREFIYRRANRNAFRSLREFNLWRYRLRECDRRMTSSTEVKR